MPDGEEEATKLWAETWAKAGPELDAVRRRELREMTHEQRIRAFAAVLEFGAKPGPPRTTSGLVEQQRLFKKLRERS